MKRERSSEEGHRIYDRKMEDFLPYEEKFSVPAWQVGRICGKNGSNVDRIEPTHCVRVFMSAANANDEPKILTVKGSEAVNVSAAKQDILEKLGIVSDLDESLVGRIIGSGEVTVRRISREYGVVYIEQMNQDVNGRRVTATLWARRVERKLPRTISYPSSLGARRFNFADTCGVISNFPLLICELYLVLTIEI